MESPRFTSAQSPQDGENYCNDCGVNFESHTSLQVHLSYHKGNLLNRWGVVPPLPPPNLEQIGPSSSIQIPLNKIQNISMEKSELHPPIPTPSHPHYAPNPSQFSHHGYPHFGQPIHFLPPQQQIQFSPSHHYEEPRMAPRIVKERNTSSVEIPAAEILDLDSNRVHVYNIIQQEQNFYRPYLMAHSMVTNGWPPPPPPNDPYQFTPQELYRHPPPPQNVIYNFVQPDNYQTPPQPSQNQLPPPLATSPAVFQQQEQHPPITNNVIIPSSTPPPPPKSMKIKEEGGVEMRGKGKGGECKRPKAYNCASCNKWFTSSGHLKRHYGTTVHKNNAQRNGDEVEPVIGTGGRGRGRKKMKKEKEDSSSLDSNGGDMDTPDSSSNVVIPHILDNRNGQVQEPPLAPVQTHYAPPLPPERSYLYVDQHQHQQFPHHLLLKH